MKRGYVYSRRICLSTNSSCNLHCTYCYEQSKNNTEFNVAETATILKHLLKEKTEYGTKIKLHGGEPFLVFHKIKQLCEIMWEENINEYYHFHITTNGTLIHGEIKEWLYKNRDKITIKLSLDGNKLSSDINRPNSFDYIEFPFFVNTWPDIVVNMTITPQTIQYFFKNIKFIYSLGIQNILSHFSLFTDWSKHNDTLIFYQQLLDLVDFYLENPNVEPCFFFNVDISHTLERKNFNTDCNLGKNTAYDFQTKRYYPCQMCFPSLCGEKVSSDLMNIDFTDCNALEEIQCMQCPFINICPTCYAENYITRGSISKRDMSLCQYYKLIFVALFKYEYARIIKISEPSVTDVKKMIAIKKHYDSITEIEQTIHNKI